MLKPLFIIFFIFSININCYSQEEYFLTLRNDEVNLRQGPSKKYPVKLVYKKKFLPVLVYDMSDNFRKIRDHENNSGWIHLSQLSKKKAAIVISEELILFKNPTVYSKPIAILKNGRLGKIIKCKDVWCKIVCEEYKGWVKRDGLWGLLEFLILEAQNLSNKKYQTALAKGSTIASVNAIIKDTSAISIKTVIAIKK